MSVPRASDPPRRRGRRPAGADTRTLLLDAARVEFAEHGFDGATVRRIAERAGVDAAMVNHWFGGKDSLFTAALNVPIDPQALIGAILPGDPGSVGERVVRTFLGIWDPNGGAPLAAVVQSVASHEAAATMMREFIGTVLVRRVVAAVAPGDVALRASLVGSQLIGLGMVRYVLKLEPLASAEVGVVVAAVAPTLQRYLTGPID